jgi:hypothetical protein
VHFIPLGHPYTATLVVWAFFDNITSSIVSDRDTAFHVVYDRDPPQLRTYTTDKAKVPAMDTQLRERDEFLMEVRERLEQAQ